MPDDPKKEIPDAALIFRGNSPPHAIEGLPDPPPWREFARDAPRKKGEGFRVFIKPSAAAGTGDGKEVPKTREMINAALMLRRPLLVTGKPGTGKSTLAFAVAHELMLDDVLVWSITTKTTLQSGLYEYDAIGRLNDAALRRERLERRRLLGLSTTRAERAPTKAGKGSGTRGIGRFLTLGPLGTALLPSNAHVPPEERTSLPSEAKRTHRPRILLIDEIDKGDIDLPNDLLHVFELGRYEIPELSRLPETQRFQWVKVRTHDEAERYAWIERGRVPCDEFPLVIMTSNGERDFPPAFLRRCLRLEMTQPTPEELREIVLTRLKGVKGDQADPNARHELLARLEDHPDERSELKTLIDEFCELRDGAGTDKRKRELAVDQLLNAVFLVMEKVDLGPIREELWKTLGLS